MSFMQEQITNRIDWIEIDGNCGITWLPADDFPVLVHLIKDTQDTSEPSDESREEASTYYEGNADSISSIQMTTGYGARLSAPGYLDCTEWTVFDTPEEAQEYLTETYGDENEEED